MGLGLGVARVVQTILRRSKYLHHGFRGVSVCVCALYTMMISYYFHEAVARFNSRSKVLCTAWEEQYVQAS